MSSVLRIVTPDTRELWLERAIARLDKTLFKPLGYVVPPIRVSIGFTSFRSSKAIGACWAPAASDDNVAQIFITPTQSESSDILAVLVHEVIHAIVGVAAGHGKLFKRCALAVGLEGKMKATVAGPELKDRLNALATELGPIPHSKLNPAMRPTKKQTTRMLKVTCASNYVIRVSRTQIERGLPYCPCCNETMYVEGEGGET